jgi:hypothetical protein
MLVVNLLGEPGAGKSVTAAGVYYELSINKFKAEVIPEVAKGYAWETPKDKDGKSLIHPIFAQQIFILGEQNRMLERVKGQREIAIMECPLIMGAIYKSKNYFESFVPLVLEQFRSYNNLNIVLERNHSFDAQGRVHDERESKLVREEMFNFLHNNIPFVVIKTHEHVNKAIVKYIRDKHFQDRMLKTNYGEI